MSSHCFQSKILSRGKTIFLFEFLIMALEIRPYSVWKLPHKYNPWAYRQNRRIGVMGHCWTGRVRPITAVELSRDRCHIDMLRHRFTCKFGKRHWQGKQILMRLNSKLILLSGIPRSDISVQTLLFSSLVWNPIYDTMPGQSAFFEHRVKLP